MAHFAKLAPNLKVMSVHTLNNNVMIDSNGIEQENLGIEFLTKLHNWHIWKQTSYNNNFRKNYAGIGYQYDQTRDAFIPPKPFNSWVLNETTCRWNSPVAMPATELEENQYYSWNESIINWEIKTR